MLLVLGCRTPDPAGLAEFTYLHVIPTEDASHRRARGPLRAELEVADPDGLASQLDPALVVAVDADRIVVDLSRYAGGRPTQRTDYLEPTFVVDRDETALAAWAGAVASDPAARPDVATLVGRVRSAIVPDMGSGFLIASQALARGRGDCTEHAVLFAALARARGIPTRIVQGIVLVRVEADGDRIRAFGHAWNEIERSGGWTLLDATPMGDDEPIAYIPIGVFEDEGPGYLYSSLGALDRRPGRVRVRGRPTTRPALPESDATRPSPP